MTAQGRNLSDNLVEAALKLALAQLAKQQTEEKESPAAVAGEPGTPGVVHLHGLPEINRTIQTALEDAEREILTAQPDGPRPGAVLDEALESVRRQIAGGVAMRTLYQHTTRFDEATKNYVRMVTDHGVQVRTLAEFFDRLIVIDRSTAFISANDDRTVASMITEPSVVRFLSDVFERSWDRAEPFPFVPIHAAQAAPEVVPAIRESIRRLLVEGHSDKVIARRLGISERSLQAHVAAIKDGLGAKNRLHLGYLLGRSETTLVL
ncbi:helix-turn-helix transcriptional regulator [Kitasatospora aureofaciens]|uniref:helix-turn-helix transcriptional regulator n=1 Tax=Kitasatospora aureofaciens TaxID=1894 RepID=UPI00068F0127